MAKQTKIQTEDSTSLVGFGVIVAAMILIFGNAFIDLVGSVKPTENIQEVKAQEITSESSSSSESSSKSSSSESSKSKSSKSSKKKVSIVDKILTRLEKNGREHRYTKEYLNTIYNACGQDDHCLTSIVAISGHESSFGTAGRANDGIGKDNNYWGWFAGGDRNYDPNQKEMAKAIAGGFAEGGAYHNMIDPENGYVNKRLAIIYSGNDRVEIWRQNVGDFYRMLKN